MNKEIKAFILAAALSVSLPLSSLAAFKDMPSGDDGACLQRAVDNNLLTGFEDETIRPADAITRAQMAAITVRAFGASKAADIGSYTDVSASDWFFDSMAKAVAMEAFQGSDNKLNPTDNISRQEAMIVLSRVFDLPETDGVLDKYIDAALVADWAKDGVSKIAGGGYLPEKDLTLRPTDKMTRLEFAQIMDKLVSMYITESGEYTADKLSGGNILVKASDVSFKGMEENTSVIIGDGVDGNTSFTDCKPSRVIVRGGTCTINSGTYKIVNAIGDGTKIVLMKNPLELIIPGSTAVFNAKEGKGEILLTFSNVEVSDKKATDKI